MMGFFFFLVSETHDFSKCNIKKIGINIHCKAKDSEHRQSYNNINVYELY